MPDEATQATEAAAHTPSKTLTALAAAVERAQQQFKAGNYHAARDAIRPLPEKAESYTRFEEWRDLLEQEIREREEPVFDHRAFVLKKVQEKCARQWDNDGLDPNSVAAWHASSDKRFDTDAAREATNALVDEGLIVYRSKRLWTPEAWKRESDYRKQRSARGRTPKARPF